MDDTPRWWLSLRSFYDTRQDHVIAQLRADVALLQVGTTDERLARLAWENAELRLYLAALMRALTDKDIIASEAIRTAAANITAEFGEHAAMPLAPPAEADWRTSPPV